MMEIIPFDISSTIYLGQCNTTNSYKSCSNSEICLQTQNSCTCDSSQEETISQETPIVDQTVIYAFKNLVRKYKKQMGDTNDISIVTGGLQQYLNKKALKKTETNEDIHQQDSLFHNLPVSNFFFTSLVLNYYF